jgi:hypothetical protein
MGDITHKHAHDRHGHMTIVSKCLADEYQNDRHEYITQKISVKHGVHLIT